MELEGIRTNLVPQRCRVGAKWLYMSRCLRVMHVMLRGVLRSVLRDAAWCAAVMCCISPRGAAWSYMMLRGNGMLGWWMMDVERHEGRWGMGGT